MVVPAPLRRDCWRRRVYDAGGAPHAVDLQAFTADTAAAPAVIGFVPWSLPAPGRALAGIEIDVEAGYGDAPADVPQPLRQAIELLVAHWYENRGLIAVGQTRRGAARDRRGDDRALPGAVAMIDPGELNRRLVLEAPVETRRRRRRRDAQLRRRDDAVGRGAAGRRRAATSSPPRPARPSRIAS